MAKPKAGIKAARWNMSDVSIGQAKEMAGNRSVLVRTLVEHLIAREYAAQEGQPEPKAPWDIRKAQTASREYGQNYQKLLAGSGTKTSLAWIMAKDPDLLQAIIEFMGVFSRKWIKDQVTEIVDRKDEETRPKVNDAAINQLIAILRSQKLIKWLGRGQYALSTTPRWTVAQVLNGDIESLQDYVDDEVYEQYDPDTLVVKDWSDDDPFTTIQPEPEPED